MGTKKMKKIRTMRYISLLLCLVFALSANAKNDKKVVILHTHDSHSCIYPLTTNLADTLLAGRGGYLRRLNMIREERTKNPNILLFDSGDFSQGSTYYTLFKGDVEVGLMNQMKYDAATIGNHEFDFGLENMARIFRKCRFPIVCCNYDFTGTPVEGLVKPYIVIKRDGVKIGVFGVSPEMDGLVSKDNCQGVKYIDPAQKAMEVVDVLRKKEKVDVVICLSHLGWDMNGVIDDEDFMSKMRGVDLILGGHSHTYMKEFEYAKDADGKMIPDNQNGKHALFVGKIEINLKK